jgi:hypothetical protein
MCVDYTSLNKACPKDLFPFPHIDQVVALTAGCEVQSFLDAYSSYHQIPLVEADQSATTFITLFGFICYVKMSFGLKNAGTTYQRCMQFCFKEQIGHNLEVYVDDIVIKSQKRCSLIFDLEKTFKNLWRFNIKLNPEKCAFEIPQGKLLGYIIIKRCIKANPDKILAIAEIGPVKNIKFQKLFKFWRPQKTIKNNLNFGKWSYFLQKPSKIALFSAEYCRRLDTVENSQ